MSDIRIFKVGDVDWIAASNLKEAIQCLADTCWDGDIKCEDMVYTLEDGIFELSDEDMDNHKHSGEDGCQDGYPMTFREELDKMIKENVKFPVHFASTEY